MSHVTLKWYGGLRSSRVMEHFFVIYARSILFLVNINAINNDFDTSYDGHNSSSKHKTKTSISIIGILSITDNTIFLSSEQ